MGALAQAHVLAQTPPVSIEFEPVEDTAATAVDAARRAGALSLKARSIVVEGRWAGRVDLGLEVCDVVTPQNIAAAMEALEAAITRTPAAASVLGNAGEAEVLQIAVDFDTRPGVANECGDPTRTVGIVFRPHHVRVSLERVGDNVLPVPRSALATVFEDVPAPLRALNPKFGMSVDKAFGTSFGASIDTNLLALAAPASKGRDVFDAHLQGVQSTRAGFYRVDGDLTYRLRQDGPILREVQVRAGGNELREPLVESEHWQRTGELGVGLRLNAADRLRIALDGSVRSSTDDSIPPDAPATRVKTQRFAGRALVDALEPPGEGFLRGALWQETASVEGAGHFSRLAAQVGYAREFRVGGGPTLGLELMGGGGVVSADAPPSERFFGGNAPGQFLYDGPDASTLLRAPRGPLLRSAGLNQVSLDGQRGGTRYWQFNAQVALPIHAWSRPLIPDEDTGLVDSQGRAVGLKGLLGKQVDVSGPTMYAATLTAQGVPPDEAQKQAKAAFAEVSPAVHFLVDSASLFAVRPLLLLDAAGLSDEADSASWVSIGAGVGVTIVTARLEAGVMRTVSGPSIAAGRSAAFLRLVFQNLF